MDKYAVNFMRTAEGGTWCTGAYLVLHRIWYMHIELGLFQVKCVTGANMVAVLRHLSGFLD